MDYSKGGNKPIREEPTMFETIKTIAFADGTADVLGMVTEAMELGRPAADHRAWGAIYTDICGMLDSQFKAGRKWVEYDWRFLNGRACGVMTFHNDGTLYGSYHFI